MKVPQPRVVTSSKNSVTLSWAFQPSLSSAGSSSSLLRSRQSRSSISSEDRKVSRTSLTSSDTLTTRKSLRTRLDGEDTLDSTTETIWQANEAYTLQRLDRLLGWTTVYCGFQNQVEISTLPPGEVCQFRVKAFSDDEESDWSSILTTATKDDNISAASLHRALAHGHMTSARKLLALRTNALEIPNGLGRYPLAIAAVRGDTATCGMLLACGADTTSQETGSYRTPLMMAAFRGDNDLFQLIAKDKEGCWTAKDRFGQTALHYIVMNSELSAVKLAVNQVSDINIKNGYGWTPLMLAVIFRVSKEVIEYLIKNGSNVKSCDKRHQTVLMQAVISGLPEIVKLLLESGADTHVENFYGHTAYDMAFNSTIPNWREKKVCDEYISCKVKVYISGS